MTPLVFGRTLFYNQWLPDHTKSQRDNGAVDTAISSDNDALLHRLRMGFLKAPNPYPYGFRHIIHEFRKQFH